MNPDFYAHTKNQSNKLGINEAFFHTVKDTIGYPYAGLKGTLSWDAMSLLARETADHIYRRTIPFKKLFEYITLRDIIEGKESLGIFPIQTTDRSLSKAVDILLNRKWILRQKIGNGYGYFYAINLSKVLFEIADRYDDKEFPKIMPQKSRELLRKIKSNKDIKKIQGLYMNLFDHNPEAVKKKITERRQKKVRNRFRTKDEMHSRLFGKWVEFIADSPDTKISGMVVSTTAKTRNVFKYLIKDLDAQPESSEENIAERLNEIILSWPYIRGRWVQSEEGKPMKVTDIPHISFIYTYRAEIFAQVESVNLEIKGSIPDAPYEGDVGKKGAWVW